MWLGPYGAESKAAALRLMLLKHPGAVAHCVKIQPPIEVDKPSILSFSISGYQRFKNLIEALDIVDDFDYFVFEDLCEDVRKAAEEARKKWGRQQRDFFHIMKLPECYFKDGLSHQVVVTYDDFEWIPEDGQQDSTETDQQATPEGV